MAETPKGHAEQLAGAHPEIFGLDGPLDDLGFYAVRRIADGAAAGFWLAVEPQTFHRARLGISNEHADTAVRAFTFGYSNVWDFASREAAIAELQRWDGCGEPTDWTRHLQSGRRRQPDGTITYTCENCGQSVEWRSEVEGAAHDEAVRNFGRRGDAPGMAAVCDDCYRDIMGRNTP